MPVGIIAAKSGMPARYYGQLSAVLVSNGIDPIAVINKAGLELSRLTDPEGQLTLDELERLVAAVTALGGDDGLTLQLGRQIRLRDHNVVGFAVLSSPSIDYALRLVARFFRLIFPAFRMRYRVNDSIAEVLLTPTMSMSHACLAFHIEMIAAASLTALEELYQGDLHGYEVELSPNLPSDLNRYRQLMPNAKWHFGALAQPGLRIRFPAAVVRSVPTMANRETLDVAEQRCGALLNQIVSSKNIGEWTRMMLRESAEGLPGIADLAATLNISTRTFHRYLKREGFVYRSLCTEERERRARELLTSSRFSMSRIAQELGYSDTSNFMRAFRAAVGCTPSEYREMSKC